VGWTDEGVEPGKAETGLELSFVCQKVITYLLIYSIYPSQSELALALLDVRGAVAGAQTGLFGLSPESTCLRAWKSAVPPTQAQGSRSSP